MTTMALLKGRLPLPGTILLTGSPAGTLALDSACFTQLESYVRAVEELPSENDGGSAATTEALEAVRAETRRFGFPRELRRLLAERPDVLMDDSASPLLYVRIIAVVQRLQAGATAAVSILQSVREARTRDEVHAALRLLGSKAEHARAPVGPLIEALKTFKPPIVAANSTLAAAVKADAEELRRLQEAVGALRVRIESEQKRIDGLGVFTGPRKRKDADAQLHELERELADTSAHATSRRAALARLEPIVESGGWLAQALDDLIDFMEKVTKTWTAFGSGVMQAAADWSNAALQDGAPFEQVEEAIRQWTAIERAARQFVATSLVDAPASGMRTDGAPHDGIS
jgi:hypothetical protein